MFDLKNKRVLLTGASGGIGTSILETMLKANAKVVITGTSEKKLSNLVNTSSSDVQYIPYNLSNIDNVASLVSQAMDMLNGNIEILINNAGIAKDSLAMRMKTEDWLDVININLNSTFFITKEVIKGMLKQRFGRIINISSIIGITGNIGQSNYSASKAGLIGMTKSLALEVAKRGITVNCVAPGFIKTDMTKGILESNLDSIIPMIPIGRVGEAEEVAYLVNFLSSDNSSYITGQTIHINGGMAMI